MALLRFRIPSFAPVTVNPAFQTYTHTNAARRLAGTSGSSNLVDSGYSPDGADHGVAGDSHVVQCQTAALTTGTQFSVGNSIKLAIQQFQAHANNNLFTQLWVGVYSSDGSTLRATLRSKVTHATELGTTLSSRFLSTTVENAYTTVAGDILVWEISGTGTPGGGGGVQGHNLTTRQGENGAGGDLPETDGDTSTTLNPWFEIETTDAGPVQQDMTTTAVATSTTRIRDVSLNKGASVGKTPTLNREISLIRSLSQGLSAALEQAKAFTRELSASIAATASVARLVSLSKSVSVSLTATRSRLVSLVKSASVGKTATRTIMVQMVRLASIATNSAISRAFSFLRDLTQATTASVISANAFSRVMNATQSISAILDQNKAYVRDLVISVATAVTRSRIISLIRNPTVFGAATRTRAIQLAKSASQAPTVAVSRTFNLFKSAVVVTESSFLRAFGFVRNAVSNTLSALDAALNPAQPPREMDMNTSVFTRSSIGRLPKLLGFLFGRRGFTLKARGTKWVAGDNPPTGQDIE